MLRLRRLGIFALASVLVLYVAASGFLVWTSAGGTAHQVALPASLAGFDREDVSFPSRGDHTRLEGWLFHARHGSGRSAALIHGWKGDRTGFALVAADLLRHGSDVLLPDLRASGASAGSVTTLGNHEKDDVLGAYDLLTSRGYRPGLMAFMGGSMGASAVLVASPEMPDVGAVISDSAFADLGPILADGWAQRTGLPGFTVALASLFSRAVGVDPGLRPVDAVARQPGRPFLFIHADGDDFIPLDNARQLRAASGNASSELRIFPSHAHLGGYGSDPHAYLAAVEGFIDQQIPPPDCASGRARC